jgi:hypothetical protein
MFEIDQTDLNCGFAAFARADANDVLKSEDEDLAIAQCAFVSCHGRLANGFESQLQFTLRAGDFNAYFGHHEDIVLGAAVSLSVAPLSAESCRMRHGQAKAADVSEVFTNGFQRRGADDADQPVHRVLEKSPGIPTSSTSKCRYNVRGVEESKMRCREFNRPILALAIALLCVSAWADQDDDDADLKPTLEERARAAVLKRWPDAKEIEVVDLTEDDDDADPKTEVRDKAKPDADAEDENDDLGDEEDCEYTLSVKFESRGHDFEALLDDDGKIKFVYEEIPFCEAPAEIIEAALRKVKGQDLVYFDKMLDETEEGRSIQSFIVGVGQKDVYLDAEGDVTSIEDAPDDIPDDVEMPDEAGII